MEMKKELKVMLRVKVDKLEEDEFSLSSHQDVLTCDEDVLFACYYCKEFMTERCTSLFRFA